MLSLLFCNGYKTMDKRKRLVPYSDSESDDESPKKKYLKKEESDSEDDFLPKEKPVRMIEESDSEDDIFSPKKNPSQMNDDSSEQNIDMRNLYTLTMWATKNPGNSEQNRMSSSTSFKKFKDLPPQQLDALFDDVSQQIKQKLDAEPSDMIRLSINHPSLDIGIHSPFMCRTTGRYCFIRSNEKSLTIQCRVQAE